MTELRIYPAKKSGQALLVCGKCERKLKGSDEYKAVAKVKKSLKRLAKRDSAPVAINVVRVGCMDLCPKGAVAVCTAAGLRKDPVGLSLVRTKEDVRAVYEGYRREGQPQVPFGNDK